MLTTCPLCNEHGEIKLIKNTDTAVCMSCDGHPKLSPFVINGMRSNNDYMPERREGFSFMCDNCNVQKRGVVDRASNRVVCTTCDSELKVSPFMLSTMKQLKLFKE